MENQTGYKVWHMIVAFLLGAVIVGGVFMIPATGLQGFIGVGKGTVTATDTKSCGCVDEMAGQLAGLRGDLFARLGEISSELGRGISHQDIVMDDMFTSIQNQLSMDGSLYQRMAFIETILSPLSFEIRDRFNGISRQVTEMSSALTSNFGDISIDLSNVQRGVDKILDLL